MSAGAGKAARLAVGAAILFLLVAPPAAAGDEPVKQWVFFTDKGLSRREEAAAIEAFRSVLAPKALARREKMGMEVNANDLPLWPPYVKAVEETGAEIVARSRWLNAVSVRVDGAQASAVRQLPFVREMRPVARATKELPPIEEWTREAPVRTGRALDYGPSLCQLEQIGVTSLHDEGFDGEGVLVAMLDTGFDTDHQAYRHLDIFAERDFVNDDAETADEPGDPEHQDAHGTATLSCVGAAYPGEIYGGAYNASFALAKTEILDEEIEIEEDYWAEAIEWADSLGADLVSSSLGYFDWYTYEDMDGNTAVTTIAADMAAARGIVVVTSMGNEGGGPWFYMIAPADGDSVLGIGAVDCDGDRVWFSSVGPTYDGRTKPDVMALGWEARVATTADTASYGYSSGTSFSCPLTAGAVALLLEGHPSWTPIDVIDALHSTASQSASPDTLMGWGIVNAYDAMYSEPLGIPDSDDEAAVLLSSHPNPFSPSARIAYVVPEPSTVSVRVYDVAGRLVRTIFEGERSRGRFEASWDGTDSRGIAVSNGVYFVRMSGARDATAKIALIR